MAREASPELSRACGVWERDWWSRKNGRKPRKSWNDVKALYPEYVGPDNPYLLLAIVFRRLSDPAAEHKVLEELAMRDGDAITAYLRLMELDRGGRRLGRRGQECAAVPGGQSAGSDAAPPARACRRTSR